MMPKKMLINLVAIMSISFFAGNSVAVYDPGLSNNFSFEIRGYDATAKYVYNGANVTLSKKSGNGFYSYNDAMYWWKTDNLKFYGTNYCLNAYNPSNGSNVNIYNCDKTDSEQHWEWLSFYRNGKKYYLIRKMHTTGNYPGYPYPSGLCLNSYNTYEDSNLNLYKCDYNDLDQRFEVNTILGLGW